MAGYKIDTTAGGTGTFTISTPNSNSDRTLTLPDEAGTVLTSASDLSGVTGVPVSNTPAVSVKYTGSGSSSFTSSTWTKVSTISNVTESVVVDTDSIWSGSKFTIPSGKDGAYWIQGRATAFTNSNNFTDLRAAIYKNGSRFCSGYWTVFSPANGLRHSTSVFSVIDNAVAGDYYELYVYAVGTSPSLNNDAENPHNTSFQAFRIS
jgi:hypothetical protein